MDRPSVAMVRPCVIATSVICWTRWTWLAKPAVTVWPTVLAPEHALEHGTHCRFAREYPGSSALVESPR